MDSSKLQKLCCKDCRKKCKNIYKKNLQFARNGNIYAQATLGKNYLYGENFCKKNTDKGIEMLKKAANKGHVESQFELAKYYTKKK